MKKIINTISEKVFGESPTLVQEIAGGGVVNLVYKIVLKENLYILRLQKGETALESYKEERWCMDVVSEMGIPTPKCIAIGEEGDYAFSFQEFIEGVRGTELPDQKERIWFTLGQYAKKFNTIPTQVLGVGSSWKISRILADDFFVSNKMISKERFEKIKKRINEVLSWNFVPMLCHGNLHPSNTIIHPSGLVYIIDWGSACGHKVPQGELSDIYTWNTGTENIASFLRGYELSIEEVDKIMYDIQTLVLIRLLSVVRWRIERNPEWRSSDSIKSMIQGVNNVKDFSDKILFNKNI